MAGEGWELLHPHGALSTWLQVSWKSLPSAWGGLSAWLVGRGMAGAGAAPVCSQGEEGARSSLCQGAPGLGYKGRLRQCSCKVGARAVSKAGSAASPGVSKPGGSPLRQDQTKGVLLLDPSSSNHRPKGLQLSWTLPGPREQQPSTLNALNDMD